MNQGTILFILIVAAYVAFEAYTVSKVSYRFEPLYIFERFAAYDRAMSRCGQADAETQRRFTRNRAAVRARAEQELSKQQPNETRERIDGRLDETAGIQESEVDALIEELGCEDIEIKSLIRNYENRARLNLHAPSS